MGKGGCKVFKSNRQEYDELSSYRSRANEVFFEALKPPSHWGGGGVSTPSITTGSLQKPDARLCWKRRRFYGNAKSTPSSQECLLEGRMQRTSPVIAAAMGCTKPYQTPERSTLTLEP